MRRVTVKGDKAYTITVEGRAVDLSDRVAAEATKLIDTFHFFPPSQFHVTL